MNDEERKAQQGLSNEEYRKAVRTYRYFVEGQDTTGEYWQIAGYVDALPGELFGHIWEVIGAEVFLKLTGGLAVFGKPGLMCKGPYRIHEMTVKERKEN